MAADHNQQKHPHGVATPCGDFAWTLFSISESVQKNIRAVSQSMYPFLPADSMAAAFELVCCFATAITAVVSYLLTVRA